MFGRLFYFDYYGPQHSCGKVMFSQSSVILFMGACMVGGMCGRGDMRGRGACVAGETATVADGTHPT